MDLDTSLAIARVPPSYRNERLVRSAPRSNEAPSLGQGVSGRPDWFVGLLRMLVTRGHRAHRCVSRGPSAFVRPNWRVAELSQHPVDAFESRENSNGARANGGGPVGRAPLPTHANDRRPPRCGVLKEVDLSGARPSSARFCTLTNQSFSNSGSGLAAIAEIAASRSPVSRWALDAAAMSR